MSYPRVTSTAQFAANGSTWFGDRACRTRQLTARRSQLQVHAAAQLDSIVSLGLLVCFTFEAVR